MSDGEALLRAILLNPAEDMPRLMYADWFEDVEGGNDAARAEFIRLQVRDLPAAERAHDDCCNRDLHYSDPEKAATSAQRHRLWVKQAYLLNNEHRRAWARVPWRGGCAFDENPFVEQPLTLPSERGRAVPDWRRGLIYRVEVPNMSWLFERRYRRVEGSTEWRVTDWAIAVAAAHPVTEFAFPFPQVVYVGENGFAAESGDLPKPLYERLRADRRARYGLAVFAEEPELMNALAVAAADWIRDVALTGTAAGFPSLR